MGQRSKVTESGGQGSVGLNRTVSSVTVRVSVQTRVSLDVQIWLIIE